ALDKVIDVGGFNLSRATELDPRFLEQEYPFEWAGAYPLPAGTHELEIGHGDDDDPSHEGHDHSHEGCNHDHHHHGNEHELDVVILPVGSPLAGAQAEDYAAAIEQAVPLFADWESRLKPGDTVVPGDTLQRLLLDEGNGKFALKIDKPGHYLVFEACGEHP